MIKRVLCFLCLIPLVLGTAGLASAAVITFDNLLAGVTSFGFDGDGDSIDDVIFSTTDPLGYNTVGPGPNMTYIDEPGLEGSTHYDLRVDFLNQATNFLNFGFALDDLSETVNTWASFSVYDSSDNLLDSDFEYGLYTYPDGTNISSFPEGFIATTFSGIASYALFDFNNDATGGQRYILDNFEGTFGSTEVPTVPEPSTVILLSSGLVGLAWYRRKRNQV